MPEFQTRIGDWSLLFVQFPGEGIEPAGILLLDPSTNELYVKLGELRHRDEEIEEVWQLLAEDLRQQSEDFGGEQVLSSFEKTLSNTFQISDRQKIRIVNPNQTLIDLFERYIAASSGNESEKSPEKITHDELTAARKRLSSSPMLAAEALAVIRTGNASTAKIEAVINKDPVLAAHLVKLSNSALYGMREVVVRSLGKAVDRLGTNLVQRQILAFSLRPLFSAPHLRDIWNHCVDVASAVRQISILSHYPEPEEAALVGLVHDIGRIVLLALDPFQERFSSSEEQGGPLSTIEYDLYGVGHPEIGADLLSDWNFPADMVEAVRNHHRPQNSDEILTSILHLAESWIENNEDSWSLSDHTYALKMTKLSPNYYHSIKPENGGSLQDLRFAA